MNAVKWPAPITIVWPPPEWAVDPIRRPRRARGARKPTLVSVAKQAAKAGIEVAPDGKIVIVTGKPETTEANNPWLADFPKATRQ